MSDRERQELIGLVSALLGVVAMILASDPDLPARVAYSWRLWLANRDRTNYARLRGMKRRADLGLYADDMAPAAVDGAGEGQG